MNHPKSDKPAPALVSKAWSGPATSVPGPISRIKNLVWSPKTEWAVVALEPATLAQLLGYVVPLALLATLMVFLRMSAPGVSSAIGGLTLTLRLFVSVLFIVFVVGLVINVLAPTFSGRQDLRRALKVAAYSLTPAGLSSVLVLAPPIFAIPLQLLAGVYGIYKLYLGLPVLMRSPREKALGYTASVVTCAVLVGVVFAVLSTVYPAAQLK